MTESVKRIIISLEVAGQRTHIDRAVSAPSHWDDLTDQEVIDAVREFTNLALQSLGYQTEQVDS